MTRNTYITMLKEIDAITAACKNCKGEMIVPIDQLIPERCPFCKTEIKACDLEDFSSLQQSIRRLKDTKQFDFQFRTKFED